MRRNLAIGALLICGSACTLHAAEGHWLRFVSGPFDVFTDAGAKTGRETLVRFEEFRHALGLVVGEQNLEAPVPIRVFVFKDPAGFATKDAVVEGRDRYGIVLPSVATLPPDVLRACTRVLLEANTTRMPAAFERGIIDFFSTLEVAGIRITAGKPIATPNADWARIHLLVTSPEYYGRLRVLLYNLRHGVAEDPAYRNAFAQSAAEVERRVGAHFAAGNFQTTSLSSRPLTERDFPERPVADVEIRLARADLLAGERSAAEYRALVAEKAKLAEAHEGLGLLALRAGRKDEAAREFAAAVQQESTSARAFIEYAKLEPDAAKADTALRRAAAINPKLDEPFALLAARDTDPRARILHLQEAAKRNPRHSAYWKDLAEAHLARHEYGEAAKAWRAGEQAAADPAERERMHQARMSIEQQRLDHEDEERRRAADEKEKELARLKLEARQEVRSLEAKYNQRKGEAVEAPVVPWWDGPAPSGKTRGLLKQVDCLGRQARVVVEAEGGKTVKLLVADAGRVVVMNGGEKALACGPRTGLRVVIEYYPKSNPKLATVGEVATIEFQ